MMPAVPNYPSLQLYTDGGARPNPGKGAAVAILTCNDEIVTMLSRTEPHATNNIMEIHAIILGLDTCVNQYPDTPVKIYTDSLYIVGIMASGHRRKANIELFDQLDTLAEKAKLKSQDWIWIRGHNKNKFNELADLEVTKLLNLI